MLVRTNPAGSATGCGRRAHVGARSSPSCGDRCWPSRFAFRRAPWCPHWRLATTSWSPNTAPALAPPEFRSPNSKAPPRRCVHLPVVRRHPDPLSTVPFHRSTPSTTSSALWACRRDHEVRTTWCTSTATRNDPTSSSISWTTGASRRHSSLKRTSTGSATRSQRHPIRASMITPNHRPRQPRLRNGRQPRPPADSRLGHGSVSQHKGKARRIYSITTSASPDAPAGRSPRRAVRLEGPLIAFFQDRAPGPGQSFHGRRSGHLFDQLAVGYANQP